MTTYEADDALRDYAATFQRGDHGVIRDASGLTYIATSMVSLVDAISLRATLEIGDLIVRRFQVVDEDGSENLQQMKRQKARSRECC